MTAIDLTAIVDNLRAVAEQLRQRQEDLNRQLAEVATELRRIDGMLRAAEREHVKPGPKEKATKRTPPPRPQLVDEFVGRVHEAVSNGFEPTLADVPGSFTVRSLTAVLGGSPSTVQRLIHAARENGRLRKVGVAPQRDGGGSGGVMPSVYALSGEGGPA